jgi:DNA-binding SARP family transcriptional activator
MHTVVSGPQCDIRLLGSPSITTPDNSISPSRPLVFAAALYLGLHRARPLRREQLATLLWPDADDRKRGERMRWLLCQLRQHGFLLGERSSELRLAGGCVTLDIEALKRAPSAANALVLVDSVSDVLAGYAPAISDTFSCWLEDTRTVIRSEVVSVLAGWLATARRATAWQVVEQIARRMLVFDRLREDASAALAEALRMQSRAVGDDLREAEAFGALVGRDETIRRMVAGLRSSPLGGSRLGLAGPSGIGKTRVLEEIARIATEGDAQVVFLRCARGDALRPISLALDLARALLSLRGALGVSPQAVTTLRRFIGDESAPMEDDANEARRAAVRAALLDLASAVTEEGSVVVVVDDAQWAEQGSWRVIAPLFDQGSASSLCWVAGIRSQTREEASDMCDVIFPGGDITSDVQRELVWLEPLEASDVARLCVRRASPRVIPEPVLELLTTRAAGLPFIAEALVDHWLAVGELTQLPLSVTRLVQARLERLSSRAERLLRTVSVLGLDAVLPAVEGVAQLVRHDLLEAAHELETAGIMRTTDGRFVAHALWTETTLSRAPRTALQLLHRFAAEWLEHRTTMHEAVDPRHLWAVATHWIEAGDPTRARRALDGAAEVLVAAGFAVEAARMLERAAEIAGTTEAALHYWRRAAEIYGTDQASSSNEAVQRVHGRYDGVGRAIDPLGFCPHHDVELLAHTAASHLRAPPAQQVARLLPCVVAAHASVRHRLNASWRILLRSSSAELSRESFDPVLELLTTITPGTDLEELELEMCWMMRFSYLARDGRRSVQHARRALRIAREGRDIPRASWMSAHFLAADSLELAGDLERAQAIRQDILARAEEWRSSMNVHRALEVLIATELDAGHPHAARALLPRFGRASSARANFLEFVRAVAWPLCALEEGDVVGARAELRFTIDEAERLPERLYRARMLAVFGDLAVRENDVATMRRLLPRIRECIRGRVTTLDHPARVVAACLERLAGRAAACDFVEQYVNHQRGEGWAPRAELLQYLARREVRPGTSPTLRRPHSRFTHVPD